MSGKVRAVTEDGKSVFSSRKEMKERKGREEVWVVGEGFIPHAKARGAPRSFWI